MSKSLIYQYGLKTVFLTNQPPAIDGVWNHIFIFFQFCQFFSNLNECVLGDVVAGALFVGPSFVSIHVTPQLQLKRDFVVEKRGENVEIIDFVVEHAI